MKFFLTISLATILVALQGCSGESVKRVTYESMQNYSRQECMKTPGADCPENESYEVYQNKRNEVKRDE